jgi:hypothetical protein
MRADSPKEARKTWDVPLTKDVYLRRIRGDELRPAAVRWPSNFLRLFVAFRIEWKEVRIPRAEIRRT